MDNNYYIYRHRRLDDFSIFYVGMSEVYERDSKSKYFTRLYSRAHVKKRTTYWGRIVEKHGYAVEIVAENLTKEEACELEIFIIDTYGRLDLKEGRLVNNTGGGEGSIRQSEEVRKAKSERFRGKNNPNYGRKGELACKSIPVYEVSTGKVFPSMTSAAEYLGIAISEFTSQISCCKNRRNNTGFLHVDSSLDREPEDRRRHVKIVDFNTGELIETLTEAAKRAGVSHKYLTGMLRGTYNNKTNYLYKSDYDNGLKPDELYEDKKNNRPVINIETKQEYSSVLKASIESNINKSSLLNKLKGVTYNDSPFQFLEDYTKGLEVNHNCRTNRNNNKKLIDKNTFVVYNSITEACETLGIKLTTLSGYLNGYKINPTNLMYLSDYEVGNYESKKPTIDSQKVIDTSTSIIYSSKKEVCRVFGYDYSKFKTYMSGKKENNTTFLPYNITQTII